MSLMYLLHLCLWLCLRRSLGLWSDIGTFDQEVECFPPDDIPGERHDLAVAVEGFRQFLRFTTVRLGKNGDLGPDLLGRDLELFGARDALEDQIGLDRPDRMVPRVLAQARLVPTLRLQHLLEREPGALG